MYIYLETSLTLGALVMTTSPSITIIMVALLFIFFIGLIFMLIEDFTQAQRDKEWYKQWRRDNPQ
jgi:hypothetical protein